jgi:hypothetical protein
VGAAYWLDDSVIFIGPIFPRRHFSGGTRCHFWVPSGLVEGAGSGAKQSPDIDVLCSMKSSGLFLGVFAIIASPVLAEGTSLGHGEGGRVVDFLPIVQQYNANGELFRIQGVCKSACTLFLGIRNMCIERDATLMFHGGHDIQEDVTGPDTRASRAMLYQYNEALRRYLLEGHYMDSDDYHTLMGSELIDRFGYRECPPGP